MIRLMRYLVDSENLPILYDTPVSEEMLANDFEIKGGKEEAWKFIDALKIFSLLANVADVKSLVIHPASTTHSQMTEAELLASGITPSTIRLSIGTEHIDDILADLEDGFAAV